MNIAMSTVHSSGPLASTFFDDEAVGDPGARVVMVGEDWVT
jgi:hypothetical protein